MMGQMAVHLGQTEAERRLAQLEVHAKRSLTEYGLLPPDPEELDSDDGTDTPVRAVEPVAEPAPRPKAARKAAALPAAQAPAAEAPEVGAAPAAPAAAAPADAAELAIPDYDSLAASQVVSRLAGLREPELAAVQRYELATRGRKTILGKIAQLQAG
jgi:pyruvate/2-oxoglutarate dehydrogenase complex dihydrolipoamide acyltransferase (E2) component